MTTGTIIIAAHNEAAVIESTLLALRVAADSGISIVVVCNGCTDETASIARATAVARVVELDVASKTAALRLGDQIAGDGPRIYLDADITMTSSAAIHVLDHLAVERSLAARPPVSFDYRGASWAVQRWYKTRERLPSIEHSLWGAGVYALSAQGRDRFDEFPDIVSDDLFVDSLFCESEVEIVPTTPVVVRTPQRLDDLLRILIRSYRTQGEVARPQGAISSTQRRQLVDIAGLIVRRPGQLPDAAVYCGIVLYARWRAHRTIATGWERDESSRQAQPSES